MSRPAALPAAPPKPLDAFVPGASAAPAPREVSLLLLGKGTVGGQLLAQLAAHGEALAHVHGVRVRLAGVVDSRRALFEPQGLQPHLARERLATQAPAPAPPPALSPLLERLARLPGPVLVDCTADGGLEGAYLEAFARGVSVVAANKKPLTLPWAAREALVRAARGAGVAYHYETTVGASLPVLDTLAALVRTGDVVQRVEGCLSGTLGFLCEQLMAGVPLSAAVREARARGYTEPHPAEDLRGEDVRRKALILARELGLPLELEDVQVEPFVPAALLREGGSPEELLLALEARDGQVAEEVARHRKEGKVLRYLARVEPQAASRGEPVARVGPVAVGPEHPAAHLKGPEALVAFTTARHRELPLQVRGAGAGGAVTASGVLADVLRVATAGGRSRA
jgi:aspartokinase/homoserine dehydrogenase 1